MIRQLLRQIFIVLTTKHLTVGAYIIVVACNAQGESEALASVKIQDLTPDSPEQEPEPVDNGGIYFLNSGKMGSNNAGLSCFNLNTLTMTVDTFMNVNERVAHKAGARFRPVFRSSFVNTSFMQR